MKTALFIFTFLFFFALSVKPTYAQAGAWDALSQSNFSLITIGHGLLCETGGVSPVKECVGYRKTNDPNNPTELVYYKPGTGGAIGSVSSVMVALYATPPLSSQYYLANLGREFGVVSPAYAQVTGSGAGMIAPVEKLWQATRNLAYLVYIVIFIAIGFMIMLRQKLNPQTVLTIQSALPSLVIGLVLVTFSYFIAALITDFAFYGIQIVAGLFMTVKDGGNVLNVFNPHELAQTSNVFNLFTSSVRFDANRVDLVNGTEQLLEPIKNAAFDGIAAAPGAAFDNPTAGVIAIIVGALVLSIAATPALLITGGAAAGLLAGPMIVSILVPLVLVIALIVQFMKLTFKLLMAYIMILINTLLGPFMIVGSALPGRGGMIGMWWKNILGNALVFPAVFAVFLFAGMILATDSNSWLSTPPFFGGMETGLLKVLIAYTIILGLPAVPDMVKKAIGASDMGAIGTTGVAGFGAGYGIGRKALEAGYKKTPLKHLMDTREKYREANRARALGLDTHENAAAIEHSRRMAAQGNIFQKGVNKVIFGFKGPNPKYATNAEARGRLNLGSTPSRTAQSTNADIGAAADTTTETS